jgi:hypothetical protein
MSIKASHEYVFNCSYGRRWVILMSLAPDQFQCKKKLSVHAKWFKAMLATYYFFHIQLGRLYIYIYIYIIWMTPSINMKNFPQRLDPLFINFIVKVITPIVNLLGFCGPITPYYA